MSGGLSALGRRLVGLGLAWALALGVEVGLGRVLAQHDPLTDLIRGDGAVLPVLLLFFGARFALFVLPGAMVAAWLSARLSPPR